MPALLALALAAASSSEVARAALAGLCGFRLGWLVAEDDLAAPLRAWLWRRAYPGAPAGLELEAADLRGRRAGWAWLYALCSCPWCTSVWATFGAWWAWTWGRPLVYLGAACGVAGALVAHSSGRRS